MRRFTLFTPLYLAAGICLTTIALQSPDIATRPKIILLVNAGVLYLFAVLSTFSFWNQYLLNRRDRPAWRQQLNKISLWLILATTLFSLIFVVITEHWTNFAIAQAGTALTTILLCVEAIFVRQASQ